MTNRGQHLGWSSITMAVVLVSGVFPSQPVQAQTFTVLKTFKGPNGASPYGNLLMDSAGSLYGTTFAGGTCRYRKLRLQRFAVCRSS
jgi:hypothetical protein